MWSRNHTCRELKEPTLGRAIPFAKSSGFRKREETPLFSYFFLQVYNTTNTRVLWFFFRKKKGIIKMKKFFVSINFTMSLRFNFLFYLSKKCIWISKKNAKKWFIILFLSRDRMMFYFWIIKIEKWVSYSFAQKIYFGIKNDMFGIKKGW